MKIEAFFDNDDSGHCYLVPFSRGRAWYKWRDQLEESDDPDTEPPDFAVRVNSSTGFVFWVNEEEFGGTGRTTPSLQEEP